MDADAVFVFGGSSWLLGFIVGFIVAYMLKGSTE